MSDTAIEFLAKQAADLMASQQAMPDQGALNQLAALVRQAYQLGQDETVSGDDLTEGAGPDDTCSCGEPITMLDDEWMHIYSEELRGTGDHDPAPG